MSPVSIDSIGSYIREQREHAKISLRQLAQAAGVSNPYLSQIERGLRKPSADILAQIAKGLRISAEALYAQAGVLDEHSDQVEPGELGEPGESAEPGEPGQRRRVLVPDAIMADPEITERQKLMLIDVYESFLKENRADHVG